MKKFFLRYGTIPIVRETGGLNDTVADSGDGKGNGFTFKSYNAHDMLETVWRALAGYSDKDGWDILRRLQAVRPEPGTDRWSALYNQSRWFLCTYNGNAGSEHLQYVLRPER